MARKASDWAKAAGEFYRKHKGTNGIESFSDVLKSSAFKKEYYAKHGKKCGGEGEGELELPEQQYGGKKRRSLKNKKGGEGEGELEFPEQQYGGKKRRSLKKGGEGEGELELPEQQYGGKKRRSLKKGGGNGPIMPTKTEGPIASYNSMKMGGGKKNKTAKKNCFKLW